jgi:hypothetical protein
MIQSPIENTTVCVSTLYSMEHWAVVFFYSQPMMQKIVLCSDAFEFAVESSIFL